MGLEENIAEAVIMAMDELGGEPQAAVEAALRCDSVDQWVQQETTKLAIAGGAEMIIPGLHALTIPAGITYLIHKLAYISWGIGALKGAYIIETENYSDLRNILKLWANNAHFNASLLDHLAISLDTVLYTLTEDGQKELENAIEKQSEGTTANTLRVLQHINFTFEGDEKAVNFVESVKGPDAAAAALANAQALGMDSYTMPQEKPLGRRISTRLAFQLAGRLGARLPAKFIVGFLPIAGAIVNAFLNAQTLQSMAESAEKYYDRRLQTAHLVGKEEVKD